MTKNLTFILKHTHKIVHVFDLDDTLYKTNKEIIEIKKEGLFDMYNWVFGIHEAENKIKFALETFGDRFEVLAKFYRDKKVSKFLDHPFSGAILPYINPIIGLKEKIEELDGLKIVLTNSGYKHSKKVLEKLDLEKEFSYVFYVDLCNPDFVKKPYKETYDIITKVLNLNFLHKVVFYDDKKKNAEEIPKNWVYKEITNDKSLIDILNKNE